MIWVVAILLIIAAATVLAFKYSHVEKNQSEAIRIKYQKDSLFVKDNLTDLPLLNFDAAPVKADHFVILFPGDGGWRDFVDVLGKVWAEKGTSVVGFNTIPYFNEEKTAEQIAKDIQRVIRNFSHAWNLKKVVLAGYSYGAEILPFIYNALDKTYKGTVEKIVMVAPSTSAVFHVSPTYYYSPDDLVEVMPALEKVPPSKVLIFCDTQRKSLCTELSDGAGYDIVKLPYGHAFSGRFREVSSQIADHTGF